MVSCWKSTVRIYTAGKWNTHPTAAFTAVLQFGTRASGLSAGLPPPVQLLPPLLFPSHFPHSPWCSIGEEGAQIHVQWDGRCYFFHLRAVVFLLACHFWVKGASPASAPSAAHFAVGLHGAFPMKLQSPTALKHHPGPARPNLIFSLHLQPFFCCLTKQGQRVHDGDSSPTNIPKLLCWSTAGELGTCPLTAFACRAYLVTLFYLSSTFTLRTVKRSTTSTRYSSNVVQTTCVRW